MGALTGSMAALLALDGFQGAPAITLESPEVSPIWADLGDRWTIEENYIKPYPVCRWAHAPLEALSLLMREHALTADQIVRLDVSTFAESAALFPGMPETTGQAQYSLAFALAAMMVHGHVGPDQISGDGLTDGNVAALLPRIFVQEEPRHSVRFPAQRCADITLALSDGRTLCSGDVEARGGPEAPLAREEVEAKLHLFADPIIGQGRASSLWRMHKNMLEADHLFSDLIALATQKP
jgi:2-methylcitrate dehydratase PrpD